jgi:hypothetical protein
MHAQVLVEGRDPDGAWYALHLLDAAALLRKLTELAGLRDVLPLPADESYSAALRRYYSACRAAFDQLPAEAPYRNAVETLLAELALRIAGVRGRAWRRCMETQTMAICW